MSLMNDKRDWLLVDKCRLEGKRDSLAYLLEMRSCAQMADYIREGGEYEVYSQVINRRWVKVLVERVRDGVIMSWKMVRRDWPYSGLRLTCEMLQDFHRWKDKSELKLQ